VLTPFAILPSGAKSETRLLLAARGLRAVGDGFVSLLLPVYLLALGYGSERSSPFKRTLGSARQERPQIDHRLRGTGGGVARPNVSAAAAQLPRAGVG
jgi:hypothetical protein